MKKRISWPLAVISAAHAAARDLANEMHYLFHDAIHGHAGRAGSTLLRLAVENQPKSQWAEQLDILHSVFEAFSGSTIVAMGGVSGPSYHCCVYSLGRNLQHAVVFWKGQTPRTPKSVGEGLERFAKLHEFDLVILLQQLQMEFDVAASPPAPEQDAGRYYSEELRELFRIQKGRFAAFNKALARWRNDFPDQLHDGWCEVERPKSAGSRYLFKASAVAEIIRKHQ